MKKRIKKNTPVNITGFEVLSNECIWSKAGVVGFRTCDNAYDCNTCPFDTGLQKAMGGRSPSTQEDTPPAWSPHIGKQHKGQPAVCRHVLTGRIDAPKYCVNNYECHHCEYDQWLYESEMAEAPYHKGSQIASGFRLAEGYYYHLAHTWARFSYGGLTRLGLDDFAVKLLGPGISISLPTIGAKLKQNQKMALLFRGKRLAEILSPVSGTVIMVNHKLTEHPDIANSDPYDGGWLCLIDPDMPKKNAKKLLYGSQSLQWLEAESKKLMGLLGPEYEKLAATGGEAINDIMGHFPELDWDELTKTFLGNES